MTTFRAVVWPCADSRTAKDSTRKTLPGPIRVTSRRDHLIGSANEIRRRDRLPRRRALQLTESTGRQRLLRRCQYPCLPNWDVSRGNTGERRRLHEKGRHRRHRSGSERAGSGRQIADGRLPPWRGTPARVRAVALSRDGDWQPAAASMGRQDCGRRAPTLVCAGPPPAETESSTRASRYPLGYLGQCDTPVRYRSCSASGSFPFCLRRIDAVRSRSDTDVRYWRARSPTTLCHSMRPPHRFDRAPRSRPGPC
jgi:hypothetical protein